MDRREFNRSFLGTVAALSLPGRPPAGPGLQVDGARINAHLAALAEFGKNPEGGVSRAGSETPAPPAALAGGGKGGGGGGSGVPHAEGGRGAREAVMAWMREAK